MMKLILLIIVAGGAFFFYNGCTKESRDEAIKGIDGIDNQVSAIANMVEGLGEQTELSASLDDVLELSGDAKIDSAFEKIMAE